MKKLILSLALLCAGASAQSVITFPNSLYAGFTYRWQWTASSAAQSGFLPLYSLYLSAVGFGQADLGSWGTNNTYVDIIAPASGTVYATLHYQPCTGCGYVAYEVSFVVQQSAYVVSPANGTTVYPDAAGGLTVTVGCACPTVNVTAGFGGFGTTQQSNGTIAVQTNGGTATVVMDSVPLPYSSPNNPFGPHYLYLYVTIPGQGAGYGGAQYLLPPLSVGTTASATVQDPDLSNMSDYNMSVPVAASAPGGPMFGYSEVTLPKGMIKNSKKYGPPKIERTEPEKVYVRRGDMIDIGTLAYSNAADTTGAIKYVYTFDNRQVANFALGDPEGPSAGVIATTEPKKWIGGGPPKGQPAQQYAAWAQWKGAELSASATYTVQSNRLPGVLLMRFQGDSSGILARVNGGTAPKEVILSKTAGWGPMDGVLIARASSIWRNSVVKLVIGPMFDPEPKVADVLAAVKDWVDNYEMTILAPATKATDAAGLQAALSALTPTTQIEKDAITALQNVLVLAR